MVDKIIWASLVLFVEFCIIIIINIGRYNAQRLIIRKHVISMISAYFLQGIVISIWMAPKIINGWQYIISNLQKSWLSVLHIVIGSSVIIVSTTILLIITKNREINVRRLKRIKPLMLYVYYACTVNFILGCIIYTRKYLISN